MFTALQGTFSERKMHRLLYLIFGLVLAACAAPKTVKHDPIFFPSPPNEPLIQYLTEINGAANIEERDNSFSLFVTGAKPEENNILIAKPYGLTNHLGKIYVCDILQGKIHVIDPNKKKYEFFKGDLGQGKVKKPINLTFDNEGNMFVADIVRMEILIYDREEKFIKAIGKDRNMKPVDVAVDDKNIYVLDFSNNEIKIFDKKSFEYKKSIGKSDTQSGLVGPTNFAMDNDGYIYVTNIGTNNVVKMDKDGHFLHSFGKIGDGFGSFARPKGIAVDDQGRIFVVDAAFQNIQIFNNKGRLLMFFGSPDNSGYASMNLPAGVSVTKENIEYFERFADPSFQIEYLVLVANQFGRSKVGVYGLGHKKGSAPPSNEANPSEEEEKTTAEELSKADPEPK